MDKILLRLRKQLFKNRKTILGILSVSFILIFCLVGFCYFTGTSIKDLTKDPISLTSLPFYSGYFSQLGNIFWFITAGISFFTFYMVEGKYRKFLLFSFIFSLFLGIDDLFMIHEGFMPAIGVHENFFFISYVLFAIFYLFHFKNLIIRSPFVLLLMAFSFLGISVMWDIMNIPGINPYIFEDGFKIMGIISWMVYHFQVSKKVIEKTLQKEIFQRSQEIHGPNLKKVVGE